MKSLIKKILPHVVKNQLKAILSQIDFFIVMLFKQNRILASLYYLLFSGRFRREHQAVLSGKFTYKKSLKDVGETSALLRRNIHRLEKGLIMKPRREIFAEGFIEETVQTYNKAIELASLNLEEKKWVTDVLNEYFDVVQETKIISQAKAKFLNIAKIDNEEIKYVPYPYDTLPKTDVNYDELKKLFIKRRSVRWYEDKEVPFELLQKAVNLASLAPSACNRQPYSFYISHEKADAYKVAKLAGGTPGWAENIPSLVVIIGDLSAYPYERDRHLIYIDASLAAMQFMLALETLGLSSCTINWPDIEASEKKMSNLLNLKDHERPIMLMSVGYAENKGGIPYSQKKGAETLIKRYEV